MANEFNLQSRLNDVTNRIQGLRPGILSKRPVRKMLGLNTAGGPSLMALVGRTSGASRPDIPEQLKYRTSGASGPPGWLPSRTTGRFKSLSGAWAESPESGVAVVQAGYREGVSPRPRTWNGYRFTS